MPQALIANNAATTLSIAITTEFATQFERNHPMVAGLATGLGVTEQQLDDLWALAGTL